MKEEEKEKEQRKKDREHKRKLKEEEKMKKKAEVEEKRRKRAEEKELKQKKREMRERLLESLENSNSDSDDAMEIDRNKCYTCDKPYGTDNIECANCMRCSI